MSGKKVSYSPWAGKRSGSDAFGTPTSNEGQGRSFTFVDDADREGKKRTSKTFANWAGKRRMREPFSNWGGKRGTNTFKTWGGKRANSDKQRHVFIVDE